MPKTIRTVGDLFNAVMAASSEQQMRQVVRDEIAYCGSRDTAFSNIRYTLGYGDPAATKHAYHLLAMIDPR